MNHETDQLLSFRYPQPPGGLPGYGWTDIYIPNNDVGMRQAERDHIGSSITPERPPVEGPHPLPREKGHTELGSANGFSVEYG
jgi:hypothetical protein